MEIRAVQKYLITSPKKMREVAYLIKKLSPQDAVEKLPFSGKRASEDLRKVIMTAIANAKQAGLNPSDMIFKEIQIGEGPRLKRFQPGARGRAKPYKKRMCHIRIVLTEKPKEKITEPKKDTKEINKPEDIKKENKEVAKKGKNK